MTLGNVEHGTDLTREAITFCPWCGRRVPEGEG